jgi:hypothetical protein
MRRLPPALLAIFLALPAVAQERAAAPEAAPAPVEAAPAPMPKAEAPKPAAPTPPRAPDKTSIPTKPAAPVLPNPGKAPTPNAQRIVAIGAINKRTGETRTFTGNPGQGFDFGSLHVTVRTCEQTPPWEQRLTGAFLLIDERLAKGGKKRVYSGWMFAESPSLHPLEHPRYDIWVKSCTMRWPETGPDTVVAGKGDSGPASKKSSAKKSPETPKAEPN